MRTLWRCDVPLAVWCLGVALVAAGCAGGPESAADPRASTYSVCPSEVVSAASLDDAVCGAGCLLEPPVPWFFAELEPPQLGRFIQLHNCAPPRSYLLTLEDHPSPRVRLNAALLLASAQR